MGPEFHISPALHHMRIAGRCLQVMRDSLKFNICNLDYSEQHVDVTLLHDRVRASIPPHLAYACTYWVSHLIACLDAGIRLNTEVSELVEQFATRHLLHWLEVLGFIGRADMACSSLETLHTAMVGHIFSFRTVVFT